MCPCLHIYSLISAKSNHANKRYTLHIISLVFTELEHHLVSAIKIAIGQEWSARMRKYFKSLSKKVLGCVAKLVSIENHSLIRNLLVVQLY